MANARDVQWFVKIIPPTGEDYNVDVLDGSIDSDESRAPLDGGSFTTLGDPGNLMGARIQPVKIVDRVSHQMGDFIATATPFRLGKSGEYRVEFIDRSILAANTRLITPLSLPRATKVVSAIRARLTRVGLNATIDDLDDTLRAPLGWDVGTTELTIINALLKSIGYYPLRPMGMRLGSYEITDVKNADSSFSFVEGAEGTHIIDYDVDLDHLQVANRIVCQTAGGNGVPVLRVVATDEKTTDFSKEARGGFWMDPEPIQSNAVNLAVLEAEAWRELRKRQTDMYVKLSHLWDPEVIVGAVGDLESNKWPQVNGRYEVISTSIQMRFDALSQTTLRRIP